MRLAGRITEWNDDKGFGFVVPNGGGERAFVHIKSFQPSSRRPVVGDLISWRPGKDERGRPQAREIRHAGQKIESPRSPSRLPRAAIGLAALAGIGVLAWLGAVPGLLAFAYLVMSILSWTMYCLDKFAAGRGFRRTPESSLHLADVLGGWPGALVAQQQFRHKTVKAAFQQFFWVTVVFNVVVVAWLVHSGHAEILAHAFAG